jgi:hypothetical protein
VDFQTPDDQLAVVARQDSIQHPFLGEIVGWGESVLHYKFGTDFGRSAVVMRRPEAPPLDPKDTDLVAPIFVEGQKKFGKKFTSMIIRQMASVGYDIDEIGLRQPEGIKVTSPLIDGMENLFVKEKDLRGATDQIHMSQGMFRALSIIVQVAYSVLSGRPFCILIDDIGEGLDFDRSTSLIRAIIEGIKGSNDQLIMTTNDRFVMNSVPLEYWRVVVRDGANVRIVSPMNQPRLFADFEYTGLSNFDFFSSDYAENAR